MTKSQNTSDTADLTQFVSSLSELIENLDELRPKLHEMQRFLETEGDSITYIADSWWRPGNKEKKLKSRQMLSATVHKIDSFLLLIRPQLSDANLINSMNEMLEWWADNQRNIFPFQAVTIAMPADLAKVNKIPYIFVTVFVFVVLVALDFYIAGGLFTKMSGQLVAALPILLYGIIELAKWMTDFFASIEQASKRKEYFEGIMNKCIEINGVIDELIPAYTDSAAVFESYFSTMRTALVESEMPNISEDTSNESLAECILINSYVFQELHNYLSDASEYYRNHDVESWKAVVDFTATNLSKRPEFISAEVDKEQIVFMLEGAALIENEVSVERMAEILQIPIDEVASINAVYLLLTGVPIDNVARQLNIPVNNVVELKAKIPQAKTRPQPKAIEKLRNSYG